MAYHYTGIGLIACLAVYQFAVLCEVEFVIVGAALMLYTEFAAHVRHVYGGLHSQRTAHNSFRRLESKFYIVPNCQLSIVNCQFPKEPLVGTHSVRAFLGVPRPDHLDLLVDCLLEGGQFGDVQTLKIGGAVVVLDCSHTAANKVGIAAAEVEH